MSSHSLVAVVDVEDVVCVARETIHSETETDKKSKLIKTNASE